MTKPCPVCELLNVDDAVRCDCGYNFVARTGGRPPQRAWLARGIVVAVGFALGVLHLQFGLRAFFGLSGHDTVGDWVAVITGYFVTIPAALLTLGRPRFAGWVFLVAGLTSSAAAVLAGNDLDYVVEIVASAGAPLVALGAVLLGATRNWTSVKEARG
jgi:hypothetical protein